ncbi:MAG: ATP-dependent DNA helicase RecG [Actinomycetales bacterium]|nr:ATP-dependent DNA helicase RecG [Actinomycetales bacterium]
MDDSRDGPGADPLAEPLARVLAGRTATALRKAFGYVTLNDLLRHYPRRYERRGELTDLASLVEGEVVTILAEVRQVTIRPMKQRRGTILQAIVTDGTGELTLTWFGRNQDWRAQELRAGRRGLFSGQVTTYGRSRQLAHPEVQLLPDGIPEDPEAAESYAGRLIAVYPGTERITSLQLAKSIDTAITMLDAMGPVPDPLPAQVRSDLGLLDLHQALIAVHRPIDQVDIDRARERLAYEEAFVLQAELARRRQRASQLPARARAVADGQLQRAFDERLPYRLTAGQVRVGQEIAADLSSSQPMHRLLQGDVGSGKTIVALRAMLSVVDAGAQAALLAPTEVLAAQHYRSIVQLLGPLAHRGYLGGSEIGTRVALLTGSQTVARRRRELIEVFTGDAGIVVGTHAMLQDTVVFGELGLVVIDEQHRFGVEQRSLLAAKAPDGTRPHVLVMTATPIPRTVAMTVFGDLEVSTLDELPQGRAEIRTHVVPVPERPSHVQRAWQRVREEVSAGNRAYVVCPRIGDDPQGQDGDDPGSASVIATAERLRATDLAGVRIGVMHGRLTADEKDAIMRRFADPDAPDPIEVLVSTTVIEVGVDVPSATIMVVLDADRFGISQLHQLRGRIGRGDLPGLCLLLTDAEPGSGGRERLEAVASTTDGFELARLDLQARREGDVLGAAQSGIRSSLRWIEAVRDEELIIRARAAASAVLAEDPGLERHPALRRAIDALADSAGFVEKS